MTIPFTFIHTADLHLDSPFKGIREINPDLAQVLQEATFTAFIRIIELCLDRQVDFLLIAGDAFDGEDRSLRAQLRFRDGLARLAEAGIPSYVAYGNHDPRDTWLTGLAWPAPVHFFTTDRVERILCQRDGELLSGIYGISYPRREVRVNLAQGFKRVTDDPFAIGLLHANVGGDPAHAAYAPCTLEDLQATGMDYWALGHIHRQSILQVEPAIVYAGNPQGRHPGEAGARGCLLVRVDVDGYPTIEFAPVDVVRWVSGEVSIEDLDGEEDLLTALEECCLELRDQEAGRPVICRLRMTGRGSLHSRLRQQGVDGIVEALRETLEGQQPLIWVDRLEDQTRGVIDVAVRAQGQDFVGDFLRLAQQFQRDTGKQELLRERLAALYGHRLGKKYLQPPDDQTLLALLEEAQTRCLDLMVRDER